MSIKMADRTPPRRDVKIEVDLSPKSRENLRDALTDRKKPGIQIPRKPPIIAFDAQAGLSPRSKNRLEKALVEEDARAEQNDGVAKGSWVERNVKELFQAFAKDKRAETSTSGYSESSDRFSAKEGTRQDLRYTLVGIPVSFCSIVGADDPSRRKYLRNTVRLK